MYYLIVTSDDCKKWKNILDQLKIRNKLSKISSFQADHLNHHSNYLKLEFVQILDTSIEQHLGDLKPLDFNQSEYYIWEGGIDLSAWLIKVIKDSTINISQLIDQVQNTLLSSMFYIVKSNSLPQNINQALISPNQKLITSTIDFFNSYLPELDKIPEIPSKWEQYDKYILFPPGFFINNDWNRIIKLIQSKHSNLFNTDQEVLHHYFGSVVSTILQADHYATKIHIPGDDSLRRPLIQPLFGSNWSSSSNASPQSTYFCKYRQNHLWYVWSPLHTMFSTGNINEKLRINRKNPLFNCENQIVLDLYGGIGYFTLPYLIHSDAKMVLSCEWNIWSVMGMIKGATSNKLLYQLHLNNQHNLLLDEKSEELGWRSVLDTLQADAKFNLKNDLNTTKLHIFIGNNEWYLDQYKDKVHHVNMGLIPDCKQGYPLAVQAIHSQDGGYLHLHHNITLGYENEEVDSILNELSDLFILYKQGQWQIECINRFLVKSYAPKVNHYVLDIYCKPIQL